MISSETEAFPAAELMFWAGVTPASEASFNRWHDREHLAEVAAIPGFISIRRYEACAVDTKEIASTGAAEATRGASRVHSVPEPGVGRAGQASTEPAAHGYLTLYRAGAVHNFANPAYQDALAASSAWSGTDTVLMQQTCYRLHEVRPLFGAGTGAALLCVALGDDITAEYALARLPASVADIEGVLAARLLRPVHGGAMPGLPQKLTQPFLLLEATRQAALALCRMRCIQRLNLVPEAFSFFSLLWELRSTDLAALTREESAAGA